MGRVGNTVSDDRGSASSARATRQRRRGPAVLDAASGKGVDWQGAPVIDPTENVLALVDAESRYQNAMRDAAVKRQDDLRFAENKRLDDLADLRVRYESQIDSILSQQTKATSDLIANQLDKITNGLGNQITTSVNSLMERIGQLERFRWEVGGRTSVQDPAIAEAIKSMTFAINALQETKQEGHGKTMGVSQVGAIFIGISVVIAAVAGVTGAFIEVMRAISGAH